ncbi:MAG: hypothetical protein V9G13_10950 [Marmoricola sp.]
MTELLKPRYWGGHLFALVALTIAVLLGLWQYSAWAAHRATLARRRRQQARRAAHQNDHPRRAPSSTRPSPGKSPSPANPSTNASTSPTARTGHRPATGSSYPSTSTGSALPVVLGWAPDKAQVELPATMEITGWLQPSEPAGDIDPDPTDNAMPQLRIASLTEHIDQDLYSAFVLTKTPRLPGLETVVPLNTPQDLRPQLPAQPALRHPVVDLRGVRCVCVGAVVSRSAG